MSVVFEFSNTTDYMDFLEDVDRVLPDHEEVRGNITNLTVRLPQHLLDLYQEIGDMRANRGGWVL